MPAPIRLRPATVADLPAALDLLDEARLGGLAWMLRNSGTLTRLNWLVADIDSRLAGLAHFDLDCTSTAMTVACRPVPQVYLSDLAVAASARRTGIGTTLLREVGRLGTARGRSTLTLIPPTEPTGNTARHAFFAASGLILHTCVPDPQFPVRLAADLPLPRAAGGKGG